MANFQKRQIALRHCSVSVSFIHFVERRINKEAQVESEEIGLERNGVLPTSSTCMIWKIKSSLVSFQPKFYNPYFLHAWPKLIFPRKFPPNMNQFNNTENVRSRSLICKYLLIYCDFWLISIMKICKHLQFKTQILQKQLDFKILSTIR